MPSRYLRDSICGSETIDALSAEEEVFFYRLIVQCDDFGRMDARPRILRARCYPLRESMPLTDIEGWLGSLEAVGLLSTYIVEGKPYLQITTWHKHQRVRAKTSKYPQPPGSADTCGQMPPSDDKRGHRRTNAPDIGIGNENENENENDLGIGKGDGLDRVTQFWQQNIGVLGPHVFEQLLDFVAEGLEADLILWACEQAVAHNVRKFAYVETILKDCRDRNIRTRAEAETEKGDKKTKESPPQFASPPAFPQSGVNQIEYARKLRGEQ